MIPFKGRTFKPELPVEVYRNLNRRNAVVFSVRQGGLVIGHATDITLWDATFVVSLASRDFSLKVGRRNVHAWVRGFVTTADGPFVAKVFYRHKDLPYFHTGERVQVYGAGMVNIGKDGVTARQLCY